MTSAICSLISTLSAVAERVILADVQPTSPPPPPPLLPPALRAKFPVLAMVGLGIVALFAIVSGYSLVRSGIFHGPDQMFGDQHLKTAVALIELHKVRYGKYPGSLNDLTFTGQWDQVALQSVRYYPNAERTAYYIEVERGWVGKPKLEMPPGFWQGTGYSETLKPK